MCEMHRNGVRHFLQATGVFHTKSPIAPLQVRLHLPGSRTVATAGLLKVELERVVDLGVPPKDIAGAPSYEKFFDVIRHASRLEHESGLDYSGKKINP